jgi:phenylacetate-CoA ligase
VTAQFQIRAGPAHFLQRLGISRKTWISTEHPIDEQLALFLRVRADVVVGTATALRRIARATEAASVGAKPPRTVFCAGGLADIETRETVKRVFGIEPVGLYGQTEIGYVAWQCEQRADFYVNADTHLVEILRDGRPAGPGELGTIVVTDLRARTMPLLRYNTADLAVAAAGLCAGGRRLPLLGSIEGRARGSVLLEEGRVLTTRAIVDHLAGTLRLGEYRLHQETTSRFRFEMTSGAAGDRGVGKKDAYRQPDKVAILRHLRQILGEDVGISIETVRPWPSDGTGKTHTIFSVVPMPGLGPNRANR